MQSIFFKDKTTSIQRVTLKNDIEKSTRMLSICTPFDGYFAIYVMVMRSWVSYVRPFGEKVVLVVTQ